MAIIDIPFAGRQFRFDDGDGTDQAGCQMRAGIYEPPLPLLMMATLLRCEGGFVDVGANTGLYSVLAACMTEGRPILAFEPHPAIARICRHNLEINGFLDRVQLHGVALSSTAGRLALYLPDGGHGLIETSASLERNFQSYASSIEVEVRRLDEMGIEDTIAVIKVDIEGHEDAFLAGAAALVERDRPIMFAEILPAARRPLITRFLRAHGYMDFRLRPDMAIHDGEVLYDPAAWNHAFVPAEKLTKFKEACDSFALPVLRRLTVS